MEYRPVTAVGTLLLHTIMWMDLKNISKEARHVLSYSIYVESRKRPKSNPWWWRWDSDSSRGGDWLRWDRQNFWCDENILDVALGGRYQGAYHHQNSMTRKPKFYACFCMLFIYQISHNNKNQQEFIFKENFMLHYMVCTIKKYSILISWQTSYSTFPFPGL